MATIAGHPLIPALIVPVLTRYELLERMLNSIDYPVGHLVVINNGTDPYWPICQQAREVSVIDMPANLGVAGSWNLGIKATPFAPYWLIANFDVTWPADSLARFAEESSRDALLLSGGAPPWCAFTVGDNVVQQVGLFDERLHPAYFEDNDYERRCTAAGVTVDHSDISVTHRNSSTLEDGYASLNGRTFPDNAEFYGRKVAAGELSYGWDLERRRRLTWD